jgi:hypothetical protein
MEKDSTNITLINLQVDWGEPSIYIQSSWWLLGILFIILLIGYLLWYRKVRDNFSIHEMSVDISSKPKMSFKVRRSSENLYIANRIYLELVTRKAAIPFEEDNDVIVEIYNSWYALFTTIRDEIKSVPGDYLKSHDPTDALIGLTINILNNGLRPHLTKFQAKFRKWYAYEIEKTENNSKSPQEIQKTYPEYEELVNDLRMVNQILIGYSNELKKLIKGKTNAQQSA